VNQGVRKKRIRQIIKKIIGKLYWKPYLVPAFSAFSAFGALGFYLPSDL
jgi:hypothetical protein